MPATLTAEQLTLAELRGLLVLVVQPQRLGELDDELSARAGTVPASTARRLVELGLAIMHEPGPAPIMLTLAGAQLAIDQLDAIVASPRRDR